MHADRWFWLLAAGLVAATLAIYWPVHRFEFVAFDDPEYVVENPMVQGGLTWAGVTWAFTSGELGNWHPLTWLSHMLDVELFGPGAGGPHVMSVIFHLANTFLAFALLRGLTGALWRSALVAALFALHPLHVESIAWVAERKDVLSAFFFLLTLAAYARYARATRRRALHYAGALVLFACGLMSKPMVVTLPCVLLLLDWWPLRRWQLAGPRETLRELGRLLVEKIPFFLLTVAASIVTFVTQWRNDIVQSLGLPLGDRLGNALVAYARYLGMTAWPADLAFFYPHPKTWPALAITAAAALMIAVTACVLWRARRLPFVAIGWFWFVGMLVPTIGIVQVGGQSLADRYTYLPHLGLFILLIWGWEEVTARRPAWRAPLGMVAVAIVAACAVRTRVQLHHWRGSEALFRHALAVTENNALAHNNLGNVLLHSGRSEEAIRHYEQALAIDPDDAHALNNLGTALVRLHRFERAIPHLEAVVRLQPKLTAARYALCRALFESDRANAAAPHLRAILQDEPRNAQVHADLGVALLQSGQLPEAVSHLRKAVELGAADRQIRGILGRSLVKLGQFAEAIPHLQAAVKLELEATDSHYDLAIALFQTGEPEAAVPHFEKAAELQPQNANVLNNLAWALLVVGRVDDAIPRLEAVLRIKPEAAVAQMNLASAWRRKGNAREAIARYESLLRLQPTHASALADLAWVLATWPDPAVRDGARAMELARRAMWLSQADDPAMLRTLAAAQAETADFAEARVTARRALERAESAANAALAAEVRAQLSAYESGQAFRDPPALNETATSSP
ncbi:MAG: tetratricopeptide repeat protein [Nibricoccus sp.]